MKNGLIWEDAMLYDSREQAIKAITEERTMEQESFHQWSDPIYPCPICGGNMRENLMGGIVLTSFPPIYQNEYQCDQCGFSEYI